MKSFLLPTDLTLASLYPIHEICQQTGNLPCNIYVVHTLNMPSGIGDLLFLQRKKPYDIISAQFKEALELLRRKYSSSINILAIEFLWSNSRIYLRHFMESRDIESIYVLKDHHYKQWLPQSINCIPALHKCKVPIEYVEKTEPVEFGTLTTLLYKEKMPA